MFSVENHKTQFPSSFVQIGEDGRLYGVWIIGNYYKRTADYHGSYPPSYLRRVRSLFPDREKILHLFSGMVVKEPGETTFDVNPSLSPDVYGKAEELSNYFKPGSFDLVIADPPYSPKDAEKYGGTMPRTHLVMQELYKIVKVGGYVIWLCTHPPLYRKVEWELSGVIAVHCGTNRVFRAVIIMQRKDCRC